jgi:predicted TIM-barrel fold metal-dependent hydrolase
MEQASQPEARSLEDVGLIVDTDAHINERNDVADILNHMAPQFDGVRERLDGLESKLPNYVFSTTLAAPTSGTAYGAGKRDSKGPADGAGAREWGPDTTLTDWASFDIDRGILTPSMFNNISSVNNSQYAVALANGFNSWMIETYLNGYDEFNASIIIAPQRPELAAEEIERRATEDGFSAVAMPPSGLLPPAGDERYDPIYEAAENYGLPVMFHATNKGTQSTFPTQYQWTESYPESHFITHPFTIIWNLCTIMYRGLPEKFPGIDWVFQECGIGHVSYMKWRLDDNYMEHSEDIPYLKKLPSAYINDSFYFTTQPIGMPEKQEHIAQAIEMVGPENIMYSSDIPHPTFDPPEELFDRINGYFDAETVDAMMGKTAERVFNL